MTIGEIRGILRYKINDNAATPAFTDAELDQELTTALHSYNRGKSTAEQYVLLTDIPDEEVYMVVLGAWINICRVLAFDQAKYYRITAENVSMDKADRMASYLTMAKDLESYMESEVGIVVSRLFRRSNIDGQMVSLDYDEVDSIGD